MIILNFQFLYIGGGESHTFDTSNIIWYNIDLKNISNDVCKKKK